MRKTLFFLFIFSFFFLLEKKKSFAQSDTLRELKAVTISSDRFTKPGLSVEVQQLDTSAKSIITATNLSEQLNREANLFIKSYGAGASATISLRGTGASQTAVLWNGMNICNPMLGLSDLSLIPSFLIDQVNVQYGGSGSILGNGAIGGAVHLNSDFSEKKKFEVKFLSGTGSFGFHQEGVALKLSRGKISSNTRLYHQNAKNNFKFKGPEGIEKTLSNAKYEQYGLAQDFIIGTKTNSLAIHGWYVSNKRELPPHMLTNTSKQKQNDEALRVNAEWTKISNKLKYIFRGGWSRDKLNYFDPAADISDLSTMNSFQGDVELSWYYNSHLTFNSQLNYLHSEAKADGFEGRKYLDQPSLIVQALYRNSNAEANLSARYGFHNGEAYPFLPSGGVVFMINKRISVAANAAMVYRVPTLNDRYWRPGGNPDLKPENGHTEDFSLRYHLSKEKFSIKAEGGIFNNVINQSLVWVPADNGIYHAENLHQVWSRGLQMFINAKCAVKSFQFKLQFSPQYNIATITQTSNAFVDAKNKQLIYTPEFLAKGSLGVTYKSWSIDYYHNYTSERFVTLDNHQKIKPYQLSDIILSWEKSFNRTIITLTGSVKNIGDENYQVIAWRAMPGRNYQLGLMLRFN